MSKKLEGNGRWESSRMILPEHREAHLRHKKESLRRSRIELDEQELELVSGYLHQSLLQREPVSIRMYHPFEELQIIGVVDRIDQQLKRFKVDGEWFELNDIEGVTSV